MIKSLRFLYPIKEVDAPLPGQPQHFSHPFLTLQPIGGRMRKHLNLWNVFLAAVVVLTAAWVVPRAQETTDQNTGPPNEAVSVQADGLGYFETTMRTNLVATDDPAYIAEPCSNDLQMAHSERLLMRTSTTFSIYTNETEVNSPSGGTRAMLSESISSERRESTPSWGGLLRMVNDTVSRTVPVV